MDTLHLNWKLNSDAYEPTRNNPNDAGFDLRCQSPIVIQPGMRITTKLGLFSEFSDGYVGLIKDRSGLAAKNGLTVLGGVIDSGYRGEWGVVLLNTGNEEVSLCQGDKIAQVVFVKQADEYVINVVNQLSDSARGEKGFGSSG